MIDFETNTLILSNTKFIFKTNLSGDPTRDTFGSSKRRANIIINDPEDVANLLTLGFKVKATKPKPGAEEDFEPDYYIPFQLNYDSEWPPMVYLVSGNAEPLLLDERTVGKVDNCYVRAVNAALNLYTNKKTGIKSVYAKTIYVEQDISSDPFAHLYANRGGEGALPF